MAQAQAWTANLPLPPHPPGQLLNALSAALAFTADYRSFVDSHAALEREYATKLASLVRRFEGRAQQKAKSITVGDEPSQQGDAWEHQQTLLNALGNHLSLVQTIAGEHTKHADALTAQITEPLARHEKKQVECRAKMERWARELTEAEENARASVEKAKSKYYSELSSLASASAKLAASQPSTPHHTRAEKAHALQHTATAASRNAYIISIKVAERACVAVGIQGQVWGSQAQTLHGRLHEELTTQLVHHARIHQDHLSVLSSLSERCQAAYDPVSLSADQDLWLRYNAAVSLPTGPRIAFEPKEGHYELGDLKFQDEPEIVWAKNRWGKAKAKVVEADKVIAVKRQESARLRDLVQAYRTERGLGDPDDVLDNLSTTLREISTLEWRAEGARAELETIQQLLGDDVAPQHPHDFKSASFTIPTPCDFCGGSVWGLANKGKTCRRCGASVHSKCEMNVPAECQGKAAGGRRSSLALGRSSSSASGGFRRSLSISSRASLDIPEPSNHLTAHSPLTPSTPAVEEDDESEDEHHETATLMGNMKYAYQASSEDEISVDVDTVVQVIELDDGSGWVKVRVGDAGREGLVPASYLTLFDHAGASTRSEAPKQPGSGSYIKALYSYTAADTDEVSIQQGETYELTALGTDYAEGWYQVVVDGRTGVVPSTYVEVCQ